MSIGESVVKSVAQQQVRADVDLERAEQDEMWGDQTHDPAYWLAILGKQVGQLGTEVLNYKWAADGTKAARPHAMYSEAKQVAAVAIAMMEAILENRLSNEVTSAKPEPRRLARVLGRDDESLHANDGEDIEVDTCYHCDLQIYWHADSVDGRWVHVDASAYADWLAHHPNGQHSARFEPLCVECKRDNANGTHDALQSTGHLNHAFQAPVRAGVR